MHVFCLLLNINDAHRSDLVDLVVDLVIALLVINAMKRNVNGNSGYGTKETTRQ